MRVKIYYFHPSFASHFLVKFSSIYSRFQIGFHNVLDSADFSEFQNLFYLNIFLFKSRLERLNRNYFADLISEFETVCDGLGRIIDLNCLPVYFMLFYPFSKTFISKSIYLNRRIIYLWISLSSGDCNMDFVRNFFGHFMKVER